MLGYALSELLEANNQMLRDHITALGIWVTATTVIFTVLSIGLPLFLTSRTRRLNKKLRRMQKEVEHEKLKITMLYETSVSLYMGQLTYQMQYVTKENCNEYYSKNLIVVILNIFEQLPFCSRMVQKRPLTTSDAMFLIFWRLTKDWERKC